MPIGADLSARYTEEAIGGHHPTKARVIDRLALAALFPDGKIRADRQPIECAGRLDYVNATTLAFRPALGSPYYPAVASPVAGRHVPFIDEAFPNCVVVYIVRNPVHVAASWQKRAEKESDRWPTRNGFQEATIEWNESISLALQSRKRFGNRLILLSYDRVFGSRRFGVWREMMRRLDLPTKPTESTRRFLDNAFRNASSQRQYSTDILRYVSRSADYIGYARLLGQVL